LHSRFDFAQRPFRSGCPSTTLRGVYPFGFVEGWLPMLFKIGKVIGYIVVSTRLGHLQRIDTLGGV